MYMFMFPLKNFARKELSLIPAWISKNVSSKVWDEIIHSQTSTLQQANDILIWMYRKSIFSGLLDWWSGKFFVSIVCTVKSLI